MRAISSRYKVAVTGAFFCGVCLLFSATARAGSGAGTTAANFLKIPVAAVPAGFAEAYTAMVGPDSILYNPAGLGLLGYSSFSGSHNQYLEGITQEYLTAAYRSPYGTVGLAYSSLSSGKIDAYDYNDMPIGNTSSSHQLWVLSFSQSWPNFKSDIGMLDPMLITPSWTKVEPVKNYRPKAYRISLGASIRQISERLDSDRSKTYAYDVGAVLVLPHHVHIGAAALNLGGKQKFVEESSRLPSEMRLGVAKDFHTVNDIMVFTVTSDLVKYSDSAASNATGLEMDVLKMFQLRVGYRTQRDCGSLINGGMGLNFDRLSDTNSFIRGMRIDYAYMDYGAMGATSRIGVQFVW